MKKLIIIRGLPGSGKSTLALELAQGDKSIVCTADDYMVDSNDQYKFDPVRLGYVHTECNVKVHRLMADNTPLVIIANTSVKISDMKEYFFLAYLFEYDVELVEPDTEWKYDLEKCAVKNVHGVPLDTLQKMTHNFLPSTKVVEHFKDLYPSLNIGVRE